MKKTWCDDCNNFVEIEKTTQAPGVLLVIFMLIFFMPIAGTFIGVPGLIISSIWWIKTPSICSRCKGRNIKRIKAKEQPTEYELIGKKYDERASKDKNISKSS